MNRFVIWIAALPALALSAGALAADIDWSKIDQTIGKKGSDLPLIEGGVEITAIHNHLLRTSIPVLYMHVLIAFPLPEPAWVMVK